MKLLILVLSHRDNNIYEQFYLTQKSTWDSIKYPNIETVYYYGNNYNQFNGFAGQNDIILSSIPESLMSCGIKTILALTLLQKFNFDYIFRTNSSSYIDKNILYNSLLDKPRENYYASSIIGSCNNIEYGSGCGYVISKDISNLIIQYANEWDHTLLDDLALGKILKNKTTIQPQKLLERYDILKSEDAENIPNNYFHYRIKTNQRYNDIEIMKKIHEIKNTNR